MAKIALIQSHPYDARFGGDGAYIQAIGRAVFQHPHAVHGLTTDTRRGRSNPLYRSSYPVEEFSSWTVRGCGRLDARSYMPSPERALTQLSRGLIRKMGLIGSEKNSHSVSWAKAEGEWAVAQMRKRGVELALLCFEAVYLSDSLRQAAIPFIAIPGSPILNREFVAGRAVNQAVAHSTLSERHLGLLGAHLAAATSVGFASEDDANFGRRVFALADCFVVGMGFEDQSVPALSTEPVVLFIGNETGPNMAGLRWFLAEVWPYVLRANPTARLRVVGRAGLAKFHAPLPPNMDCVGPVADLGREYARAQLVIAPLRSGTAGVKVKVAEAMAHGRPLVTTSIGVDPLIHHQLDDAAFVADDAPAFADAVNRMLGDPTLRARKSAGARHIFDRHYSNQACYGELAARIDQALAKTSPGHALPDRCAEPRVFCP